MISLLLAIGVIVLWRQTVALRRRLAAIEARLAHATERAEAVVVASAIETAAPPHHDPLNDTRMPVIPPSPAVSGTTSTPAAAVSPDEPRAPIAPPLATPPPAPAAAPVASRAEPARPAEGWEVEVGSNWLNKAGVLIFVTGLALLLGYSMAHVGPLGRVLIGFGIAASMLALGIVIERRAEFRSYGHGLVAGGWAGIYVTTFAMRALPAARIIDSDLVATLALLAVAAGMVWHSLRYRSQTVTALAYVAASVPLALTPLSLFSLGAALPLAVSMLLVAQRCGWSGLSLLGIGSTYVLFALRASGGDLDPHISVGLRYALLAVYWLTFEGADLVTVRARGDEWTPRAASLFAANVIGSIGCLLLLRPFDDPRVGSIVMGCAAIAYLGGAIVRARLRETRFPGDASGRSFDTSHAALAVSAALMAWAIDLRLDGPSVLLAWLLEAELLIVSALAIGDRHVRRIGFAMAALVSLHAYVHSVGVSAARIDWPWPMSAWAPTIALVAICWYVNHEMLRRRGEPSDLPERLYPWVASALVGALIVRDVPDTYGGLVAMVFALALLLAGTRPADEYRYQSYVALFVGVLDVFVAFAIAETPAAHAAWPVLVGAAAVAYAFGWWATRHRSIMSVPEQRLATIEAGAASVALLAVVEWRLVARLELAFTWAATAAALTTIGTWRRLTGLRWQAYALAGVATLLSLADIARSAPGSTLWSCLTIGSLYASGLIGRSAVRGSDSAGPAAIADRVARIAVVVAATWLTTILLGYRLPANLITMGWGLEGIVLLLGGFLIRERALRLVGLGMLLLCILKLFVYDLRELEALGRIVSFVVLGLVLLGVSWTYTKYKEQLRKLL